MDARRWLRMVAVWAACLTGAKGGGVLWTEGESATVRDVVANDGLDAVDPEELSGGAWISSFANGERATGTAAGEIRVAEAGTYRLWCRGMGKLAFRTDEGAWIESDPKRYVGHLAIAADGNHGYPSVGWFDMGTVELTAGDHRWTCRLGAAEGDKRFGTLDCFVLASVPFQPEGKWKPGEVPAPDPAFGPGRAWDFQPSKDTFDAAALLDLRTLNEAVAGQHGFVRLAEDGESFVRGDGQPIRFWAVGLRTTYRSPSLEEMRHRMRFLAKRGVNLVRIFAMLPTLMADVTDVDELEHGVRREGMFGAVMSFLMKLAGAVTPILSGVVLVMAGFDPGLEYEQLPTTIHRLRLMYSFVPAMLLLTALLLLVRYPLTRAKVMEIKDTLRAREEGDDVPPTGNVDMAAC